MNSFDIASFTLREATECTAILRRIGTGCSCMEEAAVRVVNYLYEHFQDRESGSPNFVLVRLFKTHDLGKLDDSLRSYAKSFFPDSPVSEKTKCLTLLGTNGLKDEWKSRASSVGHKTIPLISEEVVNKIPMIKNLIRQLGMEVKSVINPDPNLIQDIMEKTFNIFLVPQALGSAAIPAQDNFIVPFRVQSVIGFGGLFPDGEMYTCILFSRKTISRETSELFKTVSLAIKIALMPFMEMVFCNG